MSMAESRLSVDGFRRVMTLLRSNPEFRQRLLSDSPRDALVVSGTLSPTDTECIERLRWDDPPEATRPFDEKLVLCSSSGY
jgi:hypothetical protein